MPSDIVYKQDVGLDSTSVGVLLSTRYANGWRCSYRMEIPEELSTASLRPKLRKKLEALDAVRDQDAEVDRRPTVDERLRRAQATALARAAVSRRVTARARRPAA